MGMCKALSFVSFVGLAAGALLVAFHVGFTTVPDGEASAVWELDGTVSVVEGPALIWSLGKRVSALQRFTAAPKEFLVVKFVNGSVKHVPGPASVRYHPLLHDHIHTQQATRITANEVLVVYRRTPDAPLGAEVHRQVIHGPGVHVPTADEWLHEFVWHGSDSHNKARMIKKGRRFTKLRVVPTQMYYDVESIRSSDDAMITVMLMIFFELGDIELMLDMTHDPIGDFINAVSADVVKFAANRTYEQLSMDADVLNKLETYPQLTARAARIGYTINKVVYRGYRTTKQLQRMHDDSIETRTQLRLRQETEAEAQLIKDMVQERAMARAAKERQEQTRQVNHQLEISARQHTESLRQSQAIRDTNLEGTKARNELRAQHLQELRVMGVDLTKVLVAQHEVPDRIIRLQTDDLSASTSSVALNFTASEASVDPLADFVPRHSSEADVDDEEQRIANKKEYRRRHLSYHPDKSPQRRHPDLHIHLDD